MKCKALLPVILLISSTLFSQNPVYLSIGTGLSVPMAEREFTNAFNLGFNLHGSAVFVMNQNFGIRGDLQYNYFPYDESDPDFSGSFTATTIKFDLLAGNLKGGNVNPYAVFGAGAYFVSSRASSGNATISFNETDFGIGLGGGIMFGMNSTMSLYAETQYNFIFNDGTAKGYLPVKFGLSFRVR